jgi:hypothetical protein
MLKPKSSRLRLVTMAAISTMLLALVLTLVPATPAEAQLPVIKQAALGQLSAATLNTGMLVRQMPFFSSSALSAASAALGTKTAPKAFDVDKGEGADEDTSADAGSLQGAEGTLGCNQRNPINDGSIRVNQDCTFRRQAETLIKANPAKPENLIAGQNDSRIGYNHCGFDYSFDSGAHWGDGIPPFWNRLNSPPAGHTILGGGGTLHTYDAASDPALAFDSRGNAFFSCVTFDIASDASGLFVTLSPNPAGGSYYNNVPSTGPTYVVVEDNNPGAFHDKQFVTADIFKNSPFRDRVYISWTVFRYKPTCGQQPNPSGALRYCSSAIYFSYSTDHAQTWSAPKEISGSSPLCFFGNYYDPSRTADTCDFDQGSDPVVLPNGDIVVTFNNGNTAPNNPNQQQLAVRSTDGGVTWSAPSKVGDDVIVGEPACDFGRGPEECIPGPNIRANDYPRIAVDKSPGKGRGNLYVTWNDYRNGRYDIILSESTDGGRTWKEAAKPVNPSTNRDHYFPAIDVADRNDEDAQSNVAVSYYRSPRPQNNSQIGTLGQDYFLAGGLRLKTPFQTVRAAPETPAPDGIQAGFNGDYTGLVVVGTEAHPFWSDTRNKVPGVVGNQGVVHDEDVFSILLEVPDGTH